MTLRAFKLTFFFIAINYCLFGQIPVNSSSIFAKDIDITKELITSKNSKNSFKQHTIKPNALLSFYSILDKYKLNAPWITMELMNLKLDELEEAFEVVINLLINKNSRWTYFCNTPRDFNENKYWYHSLWQCKFYEYWLENLYVDLKDSNLKLFFNNDPKQQLPPNLVKLTNYWSAISSNSKVYAAYKNFYAFYFDCFTHVFFRSVQWASNVFDIIHEYNYAYRDARICHNKMKFLIQKLTSFGDVEFAQSYVTNFNRYEEILNLLNQERIQFRVSGSF